MAVIVILGGAAALVLWLGFLALTVGLCSSAASADLDDRPVLPLE
jgi:hypothetical protein